MGANIGEASVVMVRRENSMDLPPGFRFHPTDEEIISHYLVNKVVDPSFTARAIGDVDLNKFEPWQLPSQAKMGEKELYFFCHRDRKYPTGMRTNRATEEGYWKATGKDKEIYSKGKEKHLVGMKKTLVFYKGRAPKGEKSNWVTHEYRLEGKSTYWNLPKTAKDEWVVCRIFHKTTGLRRETLQTTPEGYPMMNNPPPLLTPPPHVGGGFMDSTTPPLPPLMEAPYVVPHRDNNLYPNSYHQPVMMNSAYSSTHPSISSWFNPQQFMPQQHQSYLHQFNRSAPVAPQLALTQCKAEQHYSSSQQLVASPEAGESADRNTDVSSMSRQENNIGAGSSGRSAFEDFGDDPVSASGQGMDMWASF